MRSLLEVPPVTLVVNWEPNSTGFFPDFMIKQKPDDAM